MRNNETRQSAYIPYRYTKNFKGHRWSNTRMLTDKYLKLFDKKKISSEAVIWNKVARPNGPFRRIKRKMVLHNYYVRNSWTRPGFNKQERVLEVYNNNRSGITTVKHVDSEGSVKENIFKNKKINAFMEHDEDADIHVMGNSELPIDTNDIWNCTSGAPLADYYTAIEMIAVEITPYFLP